MNQYDVVMIKHDIPVENLYKWQLGTILEVYDKNHFEVEISDINGITFFLGTLSKDKLELVWKNETSSYVGRFSKLLSLLSELRKLIETSKVGLYSSSFNSIEEIINEIDILITGFKKGTIGNIEKLKIYFGPTGLFQEVAIDNDWVDKYIDISSRFDELIV